MSSVVNAISMVDCREKNSSPKLTFYVPEWVVKHASDSMVQSATSAPIHNLALHCEMTTSTILMTIYSTVTAVYEITSTTFGGVLFTPPFCLFVSLCLFFN